MKSHTPTPIRKSLRGRIVIFHGFDGTSVTAQGSKGSAMENTLIDKSEYDRLSQCHDALMEALRWITEYEEPSGNLVDYGRAIRLQARAALATAEASHL